MLKLIQKTFLLNSWNVVRSKERLETKFIKLTLQDLKGNSVEIFDNYTLNTIFYDNLMTQVNQCFSEGFAFVHIELTGIYKNDFKNFEICDLVSVKGVEFDNQLSNAFPDVR